MFDCNQVMTVWNRWKNPDDKQSREVFYRHVIPVNCKHKISSVKSNPGGKDTVISNFHLVIIPSSEEYKPPEEWKLLGEDDRKKYFTLEVNDLMAVGEITVDITNDAPFREADIRLLFSPNVFSISSAGNNTKSLHGKHYKVEGV